MNSSKNNVSKMAPEIGRTMQDYEANAIDAAIATAQKDAANFWLHAQFADAVIIDKLLCITDPKFAEYVAWLEADGYSAFDRRYVTWSQKTNEQR